VTSGLCRGGVRHGWGRGAGERGIPKRVPCALCLGKAHSGQGDGKGPARTIERLGNDGGSAASWVRARGKDRVNEGQGCAGGSGVFTCNT
jgi:hypothetical protein